MSLNPIHALSCIPTNALPVASLGTCTQAFGPGNLKRYRIPSPVCVGSFVGLSIWQQVPPVNCWWGLVLQHLDRLLGCLQNPVAPFWKCRSSSKTSRAVDKPQTSNSTGGTWKLSPAGTCMKVCWKLAIGWERAAIYIYIYWIKTKFLKQELFQG